MHAYRTRIAVRKIEQQAEDACLTIFTVDKEVKPIEVEWCDRSRKRSVCSENLLEIVVRVEEWKIVRVTKKRIVRSAQSLRVTQR